MRPASIRQPMTWLLASGCATGGGLARGRATGGGVASRTSTVGKVASGGVTCGGVASEGATCGGVGPRLDAPVHDVVVGQRAEVHPRRRQGRALPAPTLFAHSVPVYPYTLAASSCLAWPLVPSSAHV